MTADADPDGGDTDATLTEADGSADASIEGDEATQRTEDVAEARAAGARADDDTRSGDGAGAASALARIGSGIAWLVGVLLIGVGLLGVAGGGAGIVPLALGLLVTPRTRRELKELCRIWCT